MVLADCIKCEAKLFPAYTNDCIRNFCPIRDYRGFCNFH